MIWASGALAAASDFYGKLSSMMQKIWSRGQFSEPYIDWNISLRYIVHQRLKSGEVWNETAAQIADEIMTKEE